MKALPVLDPKAAAIDVGSEKLHVSIAGDAPKVFGTFTGDLEALRGWLGQQQVRTVAMEVKIFLEEMGLQGWPKTSGSRGMHVNVRIQPRWTFGEVRRAAVALSRAVERRVPALAS